MTDEPANPRRTWPVKVGCGALVLLVVSAITATIAIPVIRGRLRKHATAQLEQAGGAVVYAYQFTNAPPRSTWSEFAEQVLGMDVEPAIYIDGPSAGWTESEIALLRYFPEVEGINLGSSELSGRLLERARGLKQLRTLDLSERTATRQTLANLRQFPALEHLSLSAELDEEAWQAIADLTELQSLELDNCQVAAPAPVWFRSAQCRIEEVSLLSARDNNAFLHEVRGWPSLHVVRMNRVTLDDSAVQTINSLSNLQLLELYWSQVPAGFSPAALTGKSLQDVTLSACQIQREAFDRCSSWQGRPKFDLSHSAVVD